jgi:excisionase family DNA binding protein
MSGVAAGAERPLTIREVCAELRLSRNMVYALIQTGQLPAFRAGKLRYRIEAAHLQRYKEARRATARGSARSACGLTVGEIERAA